MDVNAALQKFSSELTLTEKEALKKELAVYLNHLLQTDFPVLVQLLYRVDVSEEKLVQTLKENPTADAGELLAELLIQRHEEKAKQTTPSLPADDVPDEERW